MPWLTDDPKFEVVNFEDWVAEDPDNRDPHNFKRIVDKKTGNVRFKRKGWAARWRRLKWRYGKRAS